MSLAPLIAVCRMDIDYEGTNRYCLGNVDDVIAARVNKDWGIIVDVVNLKKWRNVLEG